MSRKKKTGFIRHPAVKFRGKIFVGYPRHQDAINLAFAGLSQHQIGRIFDRIAEGKEDIVFGFACDDGSDWIVSDTQDARKTMYGFS